MADKKEPITVAARVTGHHFGRFAMYDTFVRRKGWRAPLFFIVLMGGFATLCFTVLRDREQASLLGIVLLSVGLVLPVVWLLMYIFSVRKQIKSFELSEYKVQYTLSFSDAGFTVKKGKETADFKWKDVVRIKRDKGCSYLYVKSGKAFLLPDSTEALEAIELLRGKCSDKFI